MMFNRCLVLLGNLENVAAIACLYMCAQYDSLSVALLKEMHCSKTQKLFHSR